MKLLERLRNTFAVPESTVVEKKTKQKTIEALEQVIKEDQDRNDWFGLCIHQDNYLHLTGHYFKVPYTIGE